MGREVKRVPMDFDWPLQKVWEGYVGPSADKCPDCFYGQTPALTALEHIAHMLLIAADDSGRGRWHPYFQSTPIVHDDLQPDPALHDVARGLTGKDTTSPFGYDAVARWSATKAIIKAAGLPEDWGVCTVCGGDGGTLESQARAEAFVATEPPTGDGWQLWETVSEGSPVSPVFGSAEALATWMASNDQARDYATALRSIEVGRAPSFIMGPGGFTSGVDAS